MSYLTYIQEKLSLTDNGDIINNAICYIGGDLPQNTDSRKAYETVDSWINSILYRWKIEFRILNLTKSTFLGKLEPKQDGFWINLNKNLFTTQRRFTIAHEIAHILSYNTSNNWPTYEVTHSKSEEDFCDCFARAILLPKTLIDFSEFDLANLNLHQVNKIKELWPEFQVSPWQIIKRIFDENPLPEVVAIQWEFFRDEDCFKIIEHHNPKNVFIPKHDRAFIDTMFKKKKTNFAPEEALRNDFYSGIDTIEIGSLYKKQLHTTAFSVITSHATYVIQLIKI